MIARSLLLCSALCAPYFVVLGQTHIGGGGLVLALFVMASGLADLVSAPVWGRFADFSSRRVMAYAAGLTSVVGVTVVIADGLTPSVLESVWFLPLAYLILSVAHSGVRVARKTYIVDLAGGDKRTVYVSLSNSIIGIVLLLAGGIGVIAALVSVSAVIAVLSAMGALGAYCVWRLPEA